MSRRPARPVRPPAVLVVVPRKPTPKPFVTIPYTRAIATAGRPVFPALPPTDDEVSVA